MSWRAEVIAEVIADTNGAWTPNALRFATKQEAEAYVLDLASRWTAVRKTRTVEVNHPVNYRYVVGQLIRIKDECEGHIASADPKICARCGAHIDSERPDDNVA
jgi:hypothetical protein